MVHRQLNPTLHLLCSTDLGWKDLACVFCYSNEQHFHHRHPTPNPSKALWLFKSHYSGHSHFQNKTWQKCSSRPLCFLTEALQMSVDLTLSLTFTHLHQFRKHSLCWISRTVVGGNVLDTQLSAKNSGSALRLRLRHHSCLSADSEAVVLRHSNAKHITAICLLTHSRKYLPRAWCGTSTLGNNENVRLNKRKRLSSWSLLCPNGRDGPLNK